MSPEYKPSPDELTVREIAREYPEAIGELRDLEPLQTVLAFSSLLLFPELQANCYRIEALVHVAAAFCRGQTSPPPYLVRQCFERFNAGHCGLMEDPAEGLFVGLVHTPRGNFRILEGIRNSNSFYVQRILNIIEGMPDRLPFSRLCTSVHAMLKLSEAVTDRAKLVENSLGQERPLDRLPTAVEARSAEAARYLRFSETALAELNIELTSLESFIIPSAEFGSISSQSVGHGALGLRPLAIHDKDLCILFPTGIGESIVRLAIATILSAGMGNEFERALTAEYARLIYETNLLGEHSHVNVRFQKLTLGHVGSVMTQVDPGRYLDLVFLVDGLEDFTEAGIGGLSPAAEALSLIDHLQEASSHARVKPGFRDGITLLVGCGFGRGYRFDVGEAIPTSWRVECLSIADLVTLSELEDFTSRNLWQLLDPVDAIRDHGVQLINPNGLVNLVAWSRELGGHLVPHGELPEGFGNPDAMAGVSIRSNSCRDLRHKVSIESGRRRILDGEGRWVLATRLGRERFQKEGGSIYVSEEDVRRHKLRGAYITLRRPWWIEIVPHEGASDHLIFERWKALCNWLKQSAEVLDQEYPGLPVGPICFVVKFAKLLDRDHEVPKAITLDEIRALVRVSSKPGSSQIQMMVETGFDDGLAQQENYAERVLVEALVEGAAGAAQDGDVNKRVLIVKRICPNDEMRYMHLFAAQTFRDFVRPQTSAGPIWVDDLDAAASRIGLGWRSRPKSAGADIHGIRECTSFLNDTVKNVLDDLCADLSRLDRVAVIEAVLQNYEEATCDRDVWQRTSKALLATHRDKQGAINTIVEHQARLNLLLVASRILLESALCECPLSAGLLPGQIDLSRLMAKVSLALHLGGWSDAVHWGAMEPHVRITPLGDVFMDHSFMDKVFEPFGRVRGAATVHQSSESYPRLFNPLEPVETVSHLFEERFLSAWRAEFGVSLDGIRAFVTELEDLALETHQAIINVRRSDLLSKLQTAAEVSSVEGNVALEMMTATPRPTWRSVTGEFTGKDWFPWRLRRRLSTLRRPFIQVSNEIDPIVVVAPGLVRDALRAMVSWFHAGEIVISSVKSAEMKQWIGHANATQRIEFNATVALKMEELGWTVRREVKLPGLLGRHLDLDYGDIDVLAWRSDSSRVLAIECKDLQRHSSIGEIAAELSDFKGEIRSDGKPDHLKRHLNRMDVLNSESAAMSRSLKLRVPIQLEGHLVFKNPVPMKFAWDHMASRIHLSLFDELARI